MRVIIMGFVLVFSLGMVSCKKDYDKKNCKLDECYLCDKFSDKDDTDNNSYDKDNDKTIEKYILSPLVKEETCNYIVSGKIKYVINGETAAIIDYGDGEVDAWAVKTIYYSKGNDKSGKGHYAGKGCKDEVYTKCCKFEQQCVKDSDPSSSILEETK